MRYATGSMTVSSLRPQGSFSTCNHSPTLDNAHADLFKPLLLVIIANHWIEGDDVDGVYAPMQVTISTKQYCLL